MLLEPPKKITAILGKNGKSWDKVLQFPSEEGGVPLSQPESSPKKGKFSWKIQMLRIV